MPQKQISRLSTHLYPLTSLVCEPFHSGISKAIPLVCPLGNACLLGHLTVELLTQLMSTFADNQATIIRSVGKEVHEPKNTDIRSESKKHPCRDCYP